jgi:hypothetical protein
MSEGKKKKKKGVFVLFLLLFWVFFWVVWIVEGGGVREVKCLSVQSGAGTAPLSTRQVTQQTGEFASAFGEPLKPGGTAHSNPPFG